MIAKIALRQVLRQKRRSFFTLLTKLVGFVLLSLSLSIFYGSYSAIIEGFTKTKTAHLQIHKPGYLEDPSIEAFFLPQEAAFLKEEKNIKSFAPRIYSTALSLGAKKSAPVQMMGVDPKREQATSRLLDSSESSDKLGNKHVLINHRLKERLKTKLGDPIYLISNAADGSIANDAFIVVGFAGREKSSLKMPCIYLSLEDAQEFLVLGQGIHELAILTSSYYAAKDLSKELSSKTDLDVQPWQEIEKDFYKAMLADKKGMWVSLTIILCILSLGVLNAVLMNLLERKKEYAVLKALGSSPSILLRLIVYEILWLSFFSCLFGIVLSFLINHYFAHAGIALPQPIEFGGIYFEKIYTSHSASVYALPSLAIFSSSFLVCLFPSKKIIKTPVAEILRHA